MDTDTFAKVMKEDLENVALESPSRGGMACTITTPTAGVSDAMAAYTIGFAKLEVHGRVEDAVGAGSGTLVSVGQVRGF